MAHSGSNKKYISKILLISGIFINLANLFYFKYFNFFIENFRNLIQIIFGYDLPLTTLNILIPAGISFYTFISISFIIDSYRNKFDKTPDLVSALLSMSFFPIVISGPIERPVNLINKLNVPIKKDISEIEDGIRQIIWGVFVKVVIADNISPAVESFFLDPQAYNGSTLFLGAMLFSIQIYADFSGYSDIAIGTCKLFGLEIITNFSYPYFSRDITDFWKRWHISLTLWFRDYVFLPIAMFISSRIKKEKVLFLNTDIFIYGIGLLITWSLTGLWHGASTGFIVWGLLHASMLFLYKIMTKTRKKILKRTGIKNKNTIFVLSETIFTFLFVSFTWIFFKNNSVNGAIKYLSVVFSDSIFKIPDISGRLTGALILSLTFIFIEYIGRNNSYAIRNFMFYRYRSLKWLVYYACLFGIYYLGNFSENVEFIYFQF